MTPESLGTPVEIQGVVSVTICQVGAVGGSAVPLHITEVSTESAESACDGEEGMNVTACVGPINVTSS